MSDSRTGTDTAALIATYRKMLHPTPAPWNIDVPDYSDMSRGIEIHAPKGNSITKVVCRDVASGAAADWIVFSREAIPALVEEVERLSVALEAARQELDEWATPEARKAWAGLHEEAKELRRELEAAEFARMAESELAGLREELERRDG